MATVKSTRTKVSIRKTNDAVEITERALGLKPLSKRERATLAENARIAMEITASLCIFTNDRITIETLAAESPAAQPAPAAPPSDAQPPVENPPTQDLPSPGVQREGQP